MAGYGLYRACHAVNRGNALRRVKWNPSELSTREHGVLRVNGEGLSIERLTHREMRYEAPVYVGRDVQIPIGGTVEKILITDEIFLRGPTPPGCELVEPLIHIGPNFRWSEITPNYRGDRKHTRWVGGSKEYFFYGERIEKREGGGKWESERFHVYAVSDDLETLVEELTRERWLLPLAILAAILVVWGGLIL